MNGKGHVNKRYRVHGDGVDSLWTGFDKIAMPEHRRGEALAIVREVVEANDVHECPVVHDRGQGRALLLLG